MVITRTPTSAEKEAQHHDSGPGRAWAHRGRDKLVRASSRELPGPACLPSLGTVQEDPTILAGLPLTVIVDLRRQVSHLAADLDAVLFNAVAGARRPDHHAEVGDDRLLTPAEAAARFGVTVHRHEDGRASNREHLPALCDRGRSHAQGRRRETSDPSRHATGSSVQCGVARGRDEVTAPRVEYRPSHKHVRAKTSEFSNYRHDRGFPRSRSSDFDSEILPFDQTDALKRVLERVDMRIWCGGRSQDANPGNLPCRPGCDGKRRGEKTAGDQHHKGAAFHHLMIVHAGRLEGRRREVKRATATCRKTD